MTPSKRSPAAQTKLVQRGAEGQRPFQAMFNQAVTVGITEVLGSAGANATFYHLGLEQSADPRRVHERLVGFFGAGTQALEASILRVLFARIGSQFDPGESMTFVGFVADARRLYGRRGEVN